MFIQTVQTSFEGIMEEAKMISSIRNKNMYVKIPVTHEGLRAIKECKKLGITDYVVTYLEPPNKNKFQMKKITLSYADFIKCNIEYDALDYY